MEISERFDIRSSDGRLRHGSVSASRYHVWNLNAILTPCGSGNKVLRGILVRCAVPMSMSC